MHDFLLAKEIISKLSDIVWEKKIKKVKKVYLEVGQIAMAHDGHPEHLEDISIENLEFGLKNIAKGTNLEKAQFFIQKVEGDSWKIADIEVG
jgi:Zn finger protein HypA/HybF involved in hydrogenase expression